MIEIVRLEGKPADKSGKVNRNGSDIMSGPLTIEGNVGIGTANPPSEKLEINGNLKVTGHYDWYPGKNFRLHGAGDCSFDFLNNDGNSVWHVWAPTINTILAVQNDGKVGIGAAKQLTKLQITGDTDASLSSDGFLLIGEKTGPNIVIDNNEIVARDNGANSALYVQAEGGNFNIGGKQRFHNRLSKAGDFIPI